MHIVHSKDKPTADSREAWFELLETQNATVYAEPLKAVMLPYHNLCRLN